MRQPRGTTPRGASDSLRLTRPAAQALRYSAGPTRGAQPRTAVAWIHRLLPVMHMMMPSTFMCLRGNLTLPTCKERMPVGANGFDALRP